MVQASHEPPGDSTTTTGIGAATMVPELIRNSRIPVQPARIQALVSAGAGAKSPWKVTAVSSTTSTNSDLASALADHGAVLIAETQTAGKGRLGRRWESPPGGGLMMSVALKLPTVPMNRWHWVGVLLGMSVQQAVVGLGLPATLKWPNDLLINGRKCAGVLAELAGDTVVVGVGLNVSLTSDELPRADATSLLLAGGTELDRERLAASILGFLAGFLRRWIAAGGDIVASGIHQEYLRECSTVGARVRVELPDGQALVGTAVGVDPDGAIVVRDDHGASISYRAADVVHLRFG